MIEETLLQIGRYGEIISNWPFIFLPVGITYLLVGLALTIGDCERGNDPHVAVIQNMFWPLVGVSKILELSVRRVIRTVEEIAGND